MDVWGNPGYSYYERTETWDYLQAFIEEARIQGLKVNASINTFVGGYLCPYNLGHDGVLFRDESKKGWASVANLADGLTNTMDLLDDETDYGAKFFNPLMMMYKTLFYSCWPTWLNMIWMASYWIVVVMMTMA